MEVQSLRRQICSKCKNSTDRVMAPSPVGLSPDRLAETAVPEGRPATLAQ